MVTLFDLSKGNDFLVISVASRTKLIDPVVDQPYTLNHGGVGIAFSLSDTAAGEVPVLSHGGSLIYPDEYNALHQRSVMHYKVDGQCFMDCAPCISPDGIRRKQFEPVPDIVGNSVRYYPPQNAMWGKVDTYWYERRAITHILDPRKPASFVFPLRTFRGLQNYTSEQGIVKLASIEFSVQSAYKYDGKFLSIYNFYRCDTDIPSYFVAECSQSTVCYQFDWSKNMMSEGLATCTSFGSYYYPNVPSWPRDINSSFDQFPLPADMMQYLPKVDKPFGRNRVSMIPSALVAGDVMTKRDWNRHWTLYECSPDFLPRVYLNQAVIPEWGQLCQNALDNRQSLDINSIQFLKDFKDLSKMIPPIGKLKSIKKAPKAIAGLYLWSQYGLMNSVRDSQDIQEAVGKLRQKSKDFRPGRPDRYRSQQAESFVWKNLPITLNYAYTAYINLIPTSVNKVIDTLNQWDLFPNAGNIWEIVPFSFVVDWFTNVGDILNSWDSWTSSAMFTCLSSIRTTKCSIDLGSRPEIVNSILPRGVSCSSLVLGWYYRDVGAVLDPPHIAFHLKSGAENHWVEGSALIIANN